MERTDLQGHLTNERTKQGTDIKEQVRPSSGTAPPFPTGRPVQRAAPRPAVTTHHAAVGVAQQYGVSIEERPVATALGSLDREETGPAREEKPTVNLTKSIKSPRVLKGKVRAITGNQVLWKDPRGPKRSTEQHRGAHRRSSSGSMS